ncbi:DUF3626 domain-containing protein [Pleomorphomonas diazotrophica]|uniref:DUF3626 domain-containing protein n=1 Tax=Pleomorphomonas diazotrophica TaxID=1166257 RepID=A0A1I4UMS2_9HYPH|nr:DUF3626 domain-containing protein [Pleomorphomonas diazotrophica]PKR88364.1 DUF3626 domain-containing protein [Pleomorphomonas diazotrophica]SFM90040.1 Protein of unknown function [Pleomorphomonas diazotrophica]
MSRSSIVLALAHVREKSQGGSLPREVPITINFHPDALHEGRWVIEALAREGVYRSQFETGVSNGGLTAYPGGDRWLWENGIFGGAYDEVDPAMRPKYGALNYLRRVTGGSPRFGSAHLRLRPHVLDRTTFCYPDSCYSPAHFGVADRMGLVALAEQERTSKDMLDDYVEAHVHGLLVLGEDVEAVVLDPSHRGTEIEAITGMLDCPVEWHPGFRMPASRVADCVAYRGQEIADLAASLVTDGFLTPRDIGLARRDGRADWQSLKRVWHCVARFGGPAE